MERGPARRRGAVDARDRGRVRRRLDPWRRPPRSPGYTEDRTLDLTEALVSHSLIYCRPRPTAVPRARMLETIRKFVAERLAARPDVGRRRAPPRRPLSRAGRAGRSAPAACRPDRLGAAPPQAEAGNLAAAVGWYLANDPGASPTPPARVVAFVDPARPSRCPKPPRVDQLLPAADFSRPRRAPNCCGRRRAIALEAGNDAAAVAARERLAPLVDAHRGPLPPRGLTACHGVERRRSSATATAPSSG